MLTAILNYEIAAGMLSDRTGVEFVAAEDPSTWCRGASGAIVRKNGGIAVIFDAPHESHCVGILAGDCWIDQGHDLEKMLKAEPLLIDVLSGHLDPFKYWDILRERNTPKPREMRTRFTLNIFGLFEIVFRA